MPLVICGLLLLGARAGAQPPEWCRARGTYPLRFQTLSDALDSDDAQRAIPALVAALCQPDADATRRAAELEVARQRWSQRLGLAYEDWADATAWATVPPAARQAPALRPDERRAAPALRPDERRAWSSLDPVEQYLWIGQARAERGDPGYLADALGPQLSESGRLAYLEGCLDGGATTIERIACRADALAFDPRKVAVEVHADQRHDGYTRFVLRLAAFALAARLAEPTRRAALTSSADPAQLRLYALAETSQREWTRRTATEPAPSALAAAMEDARALQPFRAPSGCDARTWPAWRAAIAALPARQLVGLRQRAARPPLQAALELVLASPNGYLAGLAHYLCRALDRPDALVRGLGEALRRVPPRRGPRTDLRATLAAASRAGGERGLGEALPVVDHPWLSTGEREPAASVGLNAPVEGILATVTPAGDAVQLAFATVVVKEPRCAERGAVNNLTQVVSPDGLVDERTCLKQELVSVSRRPPAQQVKARYAAGLRPGMEVSLADDVVVLAWPRANVAVPTMLTGCPLRPSAKERASR